MTGARHRADAVLRDSPVGLPAWVIAVSAALAAAAVGYTTARNPGASPDRGAVALRMALIVALVASGLYARTARIQARMGGLLIGAGLVSSLWLLNGSSNPVLFSVGLMTAGIMPAVLAFLLLAQPTGHLRTRVESRFLWFTGGLAALVWLLSAATTVEPPLSTPLIECGHGCPANVFSVGATQDALEGVKVVLVIAWLALAAGTPALVVRRARASSIPARRSLTPIALVAALIAVAAFAYLASAATGLGAHETLGTIYVCLMVAAPLAILVGLARERSSMARTLAEFVNWLARKPTADPEAMLAAALGDPSLRIAYRRPGRETYVDAAGRAVPELPDDQAVALIERDGKPVAAVSFSSDISDCEPFVRAAGAAALIRLEQKQLGAELRASNADLAASRVRLMESVHAERRRLERDLHDGIQQHLVGLRIKLELAAEAIRSDPRHGERLVGSIGHQLDEVLSELRSLAHGIYPSVLTDRGLGEALRAVARSSPVAAEVRGGNIGRVREDVEVSVYFCCTEALQNAAKHARAGATVTVTLERDAEQLQFEVRDAGVGFDATSVRPGRGLANMRDRIEAVGGVLQIESCIGRGTSVRGRVPLGEGGPSVDVDLPAEHVPTTL